MDDTWKGLLLIVLGMPLCGLTAYTLVCGTMYAYYRRKYGPERAGLWIRRLIDHLAK